MTCGTSADPCCCCCCAASLLASAASLLASASPVEPRGSLPSPLAELVEPDLRRSLLHHFQSGCALKCASLTCTHTHFSLDRKQNKWRNKCRQVEIKICQKEKEKPRLRFDLWVDRRC